MTNTTDTPARKLDRAGVVNVYDTLGTIKGSFDEVIHRWKAAALRQQFKSTVEPITEMRDDVQKLFPKEFNEQREALCKKMSAKSKEGVPIVSGNAYVIDAEKQVEFDAALVELRATHKTVIDTFDSEAKRVNEFLREDIEVPNTTITFKVSWFNKTATQEMFETLFDYIEDDSAEIAESKKPKPDTPTK